MKQDKRRLRAVCVGRHPFLAEHIARFFFAFGVDTMSAAGIDNAVSAAREFSPQVIICEYELLTTLSLETWETDQLFSRIPVIAVSLTRRPNEAHLLDVNNIGGFLYLPTLDEASALKFVAGAARSSVHRYVSAPPTAPMADRVATTR